MPILCSENDFIQSELYKNSKIYAPRNNRILYYDCTNYYFEIEDDDDFRKYGKNKEHRPNPIVRMGLFMDGDTIPLCCEITPGNTNEQTTLSPLEEKIIKDFGLAEVVICTDAGLAGKANRKFNNTNNCKFITTQSIRQLKGFLKDVVLDLTKGWKLIGSNKTYNIEINNIGDYSGDHIGSPLLRNAKWGGRIGSPLTFLILKDYLIYIPSFQYNHFHRE